jgi:hypothetical protein
MPSRVSCRQGALGELDIPGVHAFDALRPAKCGGRGKPPGQVRVEQCFDAVLDLVRELEAVGPEQLDAVVFIGVVRGRDHDAKVRAHGAGEHGDRGRGHRAEKQHVHSDRGEAGDERSLDHVAGKPRVLADHDPVPVIAALEDDARRLAHPHGKLWRDHPVGPPTDAVRPEILAHLWSLRRLFVTHCKATRLLAVNPDRRRKIITCDERL